MNVMTAFVFQNKQFDVDVTALSTHTALAPSELTLSVGASAVLAVENLTVIVSPAYSSVASVQTTTFAAVPAAVEQVPYSNLPTCTSDAVIKPVSLVRSDTLVGSAELVIYPLSLVKSLVDVGMSEVVA